jgi:hypothetical protein
MNPIPRFLTILVHTNDGVLKNIDSTCTQMLVFKMNVIIPLLGVEDFTATMSAFVKCNMVENK